MKTRITTRISIIGLWLAFALTLGASISHLAWTFGTLEHYPWIGWIPAIAVDLGMAGIAYGIQQRKRARKAAWQYWLALVVFAGISALANLYHALALEAGGDLSTSGLYALDWLSITKAITLSAALPILAIVLAEIVSADDAREAERLADAERRDAARLAREAEALRTASELTCTQCGYVAKSQQGLAAHMRVHARKDAR